jgi:hypothetical protein
MHTHDSNEEQADQRMPCVEELEEELVDKSLALLRDHGLQASITAGSYLDSREVHDYYYVYSWPGQIPATEAHFADIASERSKLLICYGQDILNCRTPIKSKKYS